MVQLDLTEVLSSAPRPLADIAEELGLDPSALLTLLRALRALGLVEHYAPDWWGLAELGAALRANPGIAAMVLHHRHLYDDLADPVALLRNRRGAALSKYWDYSGANTADSTTYSTLMAESQALVAEHILHSVDVCGATHLLDLAGGVGVFADHVLARCPHLSATVMDLPEVTELGQQRPRAHADRLRFVGGNMFEDALPQGADVISFVRVLHDHDDAPVQKLLQRAHDALPAHGHIIVAEPLADTHGAEPIGHAYFGLYLWAMGQGRPRTRAELTATLRGAGFVNVREAKSPMPSLVRVLTGERSN